MTIAGLFITISTQFGLPQGLLSSLCFVESNHNPQIVHYNDGIGDSIGICQIKYSTAQWLGFEGTEEELFRPEVNIYYAAAYLRHQIDRYGSVGKGVIAYNMGSAKQLTSTKYQVKVFEIWRQQR